ncbi:MAG: MBOAT family protein [Clostridiaceae bacterium]|nr:MBOAT family protein [Clostridiaceae bacterium]
MVFSSMTFLFVFLLTVMLFYFTLPGRNLKNLILLIFSLIFYAWGEPIYIGIMIISILNDYTFAQLVEKYRETGKKNRAKLCLILSLTVNLGLLGFFKYAGFITEIINAISGTSLVVHQLPLPVGISFYTFQTMSYTIDVYFGNVKAQKKIIPFSTYVTLFPQLIAGPIVRYSDVEYELENRRESVSMVADGLKRFIAGLAKKVILANQMGLAADTIFNSDPANVSTLLVWTGALAYAFQIYFDFSGYSDMAIGLGKVFGFNFMENFNYPYISKSITEFWRRWHISLGTWFRDYVYIPLGGNRGTTARVIKNLAIVWFLTGLWHGASWNYVIWGLYYFVLLVLEKYVFSRIIEKIPTFIRRIYTLFFVVVGWVVFRVENLEHLAVFLKRMFIYVPVNKIDIITNYQNLLYVIPYFALALTASLPLFSLVKKKIENGNSTLLKISCDALSLIVLLISIMYLTGESFNPFIYFRF